MSGRNYLSEPINVADPVIRESDLLAALNEVAADLPETDPQLPEKLWREPPGGVIRYTGTYGVVGSSLVGTAWVS